MEALTLAESLLFLVAMFGIIGGGIRIYQVIRKSAIESTRSRINVDNKLLSLTTKLEDLASKMKENQTQNAKDHGELHKRIDGLSQEIHNLSEQLTSALTTLLPSSPSMKAKKQRSRKTPSK